MPISNLPYKSLHKPTLCDDVGQVGASVIPTRMQSASRAREITKFLADKKPKTLITDGAPNFHEAYEQECYINRRLDHPNTFVKFDLLAGYTTIRWNA